MVKCWTANIPRSFERRRGATPSVRNNILEIHTEPTRGSPRGDALRVYLEDIISDKICPQVPTYLPPLLEIISSRYTRSQHVDPPGGTRSVCISRILFRTKFVRKYPPTTPAPVETPRSVGRPAFQHFHYFPTRGRSPETCPLPACFTCIFTSKRSALSIPPSEDAENPAFPEKKTLFPN